MKTNSSNKYKKGFTLLELLVVVVIIGLLSALILVAMGTARGKGGDASVKANLDTVRAQSELFASLNNNSFLPLGGSTFTIATCPVYSASGTNMLSKDANISSAIAEAVSRAGNGSSCYNSGSVWAVAVGLKSDANVSWCVDASGASRSVPSAPSSAISSSTFLCN